MPFYNPEKRPSKHIIPNEIAMKTFWGENVMLAVVDLQAGAVLPLHSHPHEQAGMVMEGELEFDLNGEVQHLGPGDIYIIPGNMPHLVKVGSKPAKVLDIFSPVREEYKY